MVTMKHGTQSKATDEGSRTMNTNNALDLESGTDPKLVVFSITDLEEGKTKWERVGLATRNPDGSMNVKLCKAPSGRLHIRSVVLHGNDWVSARHDERASARS